MTATTGKLLLPKGARLVHIGPQKTGTTTVQHALHHARAELGSYGVVYPGRGTRPREASRAVLGFRPLRGRPRAKMESWYELVREVEAAGDRRVCISTEDFGKAGPEDAERIVHDLGGDRVHVAMAARRLDKLLPSQWQERVKMMHTFSYPDWLETVLGDNPGDPVWRNVWVPHDTEALVERWARVVGRDRVTLLISDDADRDLIPRSFEQMLGLPEGMLSSYAGPSNQSLSMNRIELIRHVNMVFASGHWPPRIVKPLLRAGLRPDLKRTPWADYEQPIPPLPPWAAERVAELSDKRVEAVKALGVRVVGDPEWLRVRAPGEPDAAAGATGPVMVSPELAAAAVQESLEGAARLQTRLRRQQRRRTASAEPRTTPGLLVEQATTRDLLNALARRGTRRLPGRRRR